MEEVIPPRVSRVDNLIDRRRNESDARDIIKEVERLVSFEGEQRYRWIWELFQNARDEAGEGVQIICEKKHGKFIFQHNGKPFLTDHLIALTLRSSTKPLDGADGNAGKFGTGFVTTHLLSKSVKISGVHENEEGRRRFVHRLDRNSVNLDSMMATLATSIQNIREIDIVPSEDIDNIWNSFEYELTAVSNDVAEGGMKQLEANLAFSLLINEDKIKSVKIIDGDYESTLTIHKTDNAVGDISFLQLVNDRQLGSKEGLLYKEYKDLIIAIPVKVKEGHYYLNRISGTAHLFKELPLIGSEDFLVPNIIQHTNFQPVELRDGVRTKRLTEDLSEEDSTADKNRQVFADYITAFPDFLMTLIKEGVKNLHLMAESSLPSNAGAYYGKDWLKDNLQIKLRSEVLKYKLVLNVNSEAIEISEALFPDCLDENLPAFQNLLAALFPDKTANQDSYEDWKRIISSDSDNWPPNILIDIENLVTKITPELLVTEFENQTTIVGWLQDLIKYLEETKNESLGVDFPIYPTQKGGLARQNDVFSEIDFSDQWKLISKGLGRDLEEELLPKNFEARYVLDFNIKEFLDAMNSAIGTLKLDTATNEQKQAVIDICCTFEAARAPRREVWFDLLSRLLPDKVKGKVIIELKENYNWDSAEKWALKMTGLIIKESIDIENFTSLYFKDDLEGAVKWLNEFIAFVFRNEENRAALEYEIILTQDGIFKKYSDHLFREDNPDKFLPILKKLYKEQAEFEDPATFLIDNGISDSNLRVGDVSILTRPIDDIFKSREVEDKVKEGLEYHDLFMALKELTEDEYWANVFPIFVEKQPILFIKAFGPGSSVGRLMKIKKPIDEMEKLAALSLSADQLKQLDDAVKVIGNVQSLIDKAEQMAIAAEEVRWRQDVGAAAEQAFLQAIGEVHPSFLEPENPDNGRDFIIRIGELHYNIEIKSAIEHKESVKMSLRQGEEASKERGNYALCVISRPFGTLTNKEQFIKTAQFVIDIGFQIGDKVDNWREGMEGAHADENVSVELENKSGYVNIKKNTWEGGIGFVAFVEELKKYFTIN